MTAARYWHTLRHLRIQQIAGRVVFYLGRPVPDLRPAPGLRPTQIVWTAPGWREPCLLDPTTARFLNEAASIADPAVWQDNSRGRLWLYNLHYFDDLTALGAEQRRAWHGALINRWIEENPPAVGPGWEPYPTSLRIANWIKWDLSSPSALRLGPAALRSLAVQTRWLSRRLEYHILGNHLWANGKALLMAGLFFEGSEGAAWRKKGLEILSAELEEQVLADGGHFERSPMYHALILEDVLDLVQVAGVFAGVMPPDLVGRLRSVATRMLRWLRVMTHPDGDVSFFNDAAFGIAAPCRVLDAYATASGVDIDTHALAPVEWLRESGYIRLSNSRAVVFCDVAPVGPDYQPGHAHADTLSFELSLDGRRVIVNGGTSTYTPGVARSEQRGTAAHNTVEINGINSSDVWSGFRVARRARPFDVRAGCTADAVWAEAAHDGYQHRPGRVIHRRAWRLESGGMSVTDTLEGRYEYATARLIFHPDVAPNIDAVLDLSCAPPASVVERQTTWHPQFGRAIETRVREFRLAGPQTTTVLTWP